jgi:flagellar biogenesis protein FliO
MTDPMIKRKQTENDTAGVATGAGLATWLLARLRGTRSPLPRLALVERIALAPRQSLSLIEAEGRRFLVATSAEGAPAFYPLDRDCRQSNVLQSGIETRRFSESSKTVGRQASERTTRISW